MFVTQSCIPLYGQGPPLTIEICMFCACSCLQRAKVARPMQKGEVVLAKARIDVPFLVLLHEPHHSIHISGPDALLQLHRDLGEGLKILQLLRVRASECMLTHRNSRVRLFAFTRTKRRDCPFPACYIVHSSALVSCTF